MVIILRHPETGELVLSPQGFSFTTLIFGSFVPLLRGWMVGLVGILALGLFSSFFWAHLLGGFFLNWFYTQYLLWRGFLPGCEADYELLRARGIQARGICDENGNCSLYVHRAVGHKASFRDRPRLWVASFMRKKSKF
ncbi:MAG: hypothetical protein OXT67_08475 [Zetaproteobacteria bacterium]|nr:hypothetical protein [Zetaproteobacteria bacterium]